MSRLHSGESQHGEYIQNIPQNRHVYLEQASSDSIDSPNPSPAYYDQARHRAFGTYRPLEPPSQGERVLESIEGPVHAAAKTVTDHASYLIKSDCLHANENVEPYRRTIHLRKVDRPFGDEPRLITRRHADSEARYVQDSHHSPKLQRSFLVPIERAGRRETSKQQPVVIHHVNGFGPTNNLDATPEVQQVIQLDQAGVLPPPFLPTKSHSAISDGTFSSHHCQVLVSPQQTPQNPLSGRNHVDHLVSRAVPIIDQYCSAHYTSYKTSPYVSSHNEDHHAPDTVIRGGLQQGAVNGMLINDNAPHRRPIFGEAAQIKRYSAQSEHPQPAAQGFTGPKQPGAHLMQKQPVISRAHKERRVLPLERSFEDRTPLWQHDLEQGAENPELIYIDRPSGWLHTPRMKPTSQLSWQHIQSQRHDTASDYTGQHEAPRSVGKPWLTEDW